MDNRLRFLYQLTAFDDGGTQEAKQTSRLEEWGQAVSLLESEMLSTVRTSCDADRNKVEKSETSHCREKLLRSTLTARTANRHR